MQSMTNSAHSYCYRGGRLLLLTGALLLAACAGSPEPVNPNAGRYSIAQDRAPTAPVDLASIPDVVPEPVTRTLAGNRSPYSVLGKTYHVLPSEEGYREQGVASWYGEKFHGHRTSNGEVFDMYRVSAAHKSLPIPSFLRVTNLDNNRSIIVRVNDRGPFHGDRVIDLSYAAAMKLDYADRGTARVLLEAVTDAAYADRPAVALAGRSAAGQDQANPGHYLQVAAFADIDSARRLSAQLEDMTAHQVFIRSVRTPDAGVLHRVRIGPIQDAREIQQLTRSVVAANLGRPYTVSE